MAPAGGGAQAAVVAQLPSRARPAELLPGARRSTLPIAATRPDPRQQVLLERKERKGGRRREGSSRRTPVKRTALWAHSLQSHPRAQ